MFVNKQDTTHFWVTNANTELACMSLETCPDHWLSGALTSPLCLEIYRVCFAFSFEKRKTTRKHFFLIGLNILREVDAKSESESELAVPEMEKRL